MTEREVLLHPLNPKLARPHLLIREGCAGEEFVRIAMALGHWWVAKTWLTANPHLMKDNPRACLRVGRQVGWPKLDKATEYEFSFLNDWFEDGLQTGADVPAGMAYMGLEASDICLARGDRALGMTYLTSALVADSTLWEAAGKLALMCGELGDEAPEESVRAVREWCTEFRGTGLADLIMLMGEGRRLDAQAAGDIWNRGWTHHFVASSVARQYLTHRHYRDWIRVGWAGSKQVGRLWRASLVVRSPKP